jgi:hypothetical protein
MALLRKEGQQACKQCTSVCTMHEGLKAGDTQHSSNRTLLYSPSCSSCANNLSLIGRDVLECSALFATSSLKCL